jgi:hypothetical protein
MPQWFHFLLLFFFISVDLLATSADEIARKSYEVNHSRYFKNIMIPKKGRSTILAIKRGVGMKPTVTRLERFLSNDYHDGIVESKDLIIIRTGKLSGLGVLMTSYLDPQRSHEYMMWIPALRKVRRIAEPSDATGLSLTDISFLEDAKLRRFEDETYTLLETKIMDLKLLTIPYKKGEFGADGDQLPSRETFVKNRKIAVIKSTYKKPHHWYEYRISYIDSDYFTDYMTEYYKGGVVIKRVYRHWISLDGISDPTFKIWYYWYSKDLITGNEIANYIPPARIKANQTSSPSFWSLSTLEKIKR